MKENKEYYAFISYKSEDVEWAIWLQHELEHYHLPASFNGRTDMRQELRPVFRDIDELSAGNLPEQIRQALENSQNLIVVCSPQAATSPWVNQEVEMFISLGRTDRIFPFIVEGKSPDEFFPPALLALPKNKERLGGDASKQGRDVAFVKIVAGMLGLGFDSLWKRYEKEKAEDERKKREERDRFLRIQSRFISEKVHQLIDEGDTDLAKRLILEILPTSLIYPNRPYTEEAEWALRKATVSRTVHLVIRGHEKSVRSVAYSPSGDIIASASADKMIKFWDSNTGRCINTIKESGAINTVSFDPHNGYRVVSASVYNCARIWDVKNGTCLLTLKGHEKGICSAHFSPNGQKIVTASKDCSIRIWDVNSGQCIHILKEHNSFVNSAEFSPDGKLIISASSDRTVRLWDSSTGECLNIFKGHLGSVYSASFNEDGSMIVTSSDDKNVFLWDTKGNLIKEFKGHKKAVLSARFSHDNKSVISSSLDNTIRIWDSDTGYCLKVINHHRDSVNCISVSPSFNRIASASSDCTIQIFGGDKNEYDSSYTGYAKSNLKRNIVLYEDIECDYLKFGIINACTGENIVKMNIESIGVIHKLSNIYLSKDGYFNEHASSIYVSPNGDWRHDPYILLSPNAKFLGIDVLDTIRFVELLSGNVVDIKVNGDSVDKLLHLKDMNSFYFLNDEFVIVKTNYTDKYSIKETSSITIASSFINIWNVRLGSKVFSYEGNFFDEDIIAISPNEDRMLVGTSTNISLLDLCSGNCIKNVEISSLLCGKADKISKLKVLYSPDGNYVAIGCTVDLDNYNVWQENHRYQVCLFDNELNPIKNIANASLACFSPISKQILIWNVYGLYEVWDIVTDNTISAIKNFFFDEIEGNIPVFSESGRILVTATGDFELMICNLLSFSMFKSIDRHSDAILSIDVSPDEDYIATSSVDMTIKIWTVATGKCVQTFKGHTSRVLKVTFSIDGRKIISTSYDNTIKVWDFPPLQELIDQNRERFKDNPLTEEERKQYYLE